MNNFNNADFGADELTPIGIPGQKEKEDRRIMLGWSAALIALYLAFKFLKKK